MQISSIIVMSLHLQCVQFPEFQRTHISRNTFQWLLPNIAYAIQKRVLRNLNYVQCLNEGPMEKTWFMAPMEKALRHQRNMSSWFMAPMEKAWFYERLFKKIQHKRYHANQNQFYAMHEVDKSNITVVFKEFDVAYIFFLLFSFYYHC